MVRLWDKALELLGQKSTEVSAEGQSVLHGYIQSTRGLHENPTNETLAEVRKSTAKIDAYLRRNLDDPDFRSAHASINDLMTDHQEETESPIPIQLPVDQLA
jgi:hypothetical protein